jgi:ACT domain-containing protein
MALRVNLRGWGKVKKENGVRRVVWMPTELDQIAESTRKKLGLNRSAFYKYAITRMLQELSVLSKTVHKEESGD